MWTFENTETTSASPSHLWARYADPARWSEWDDAIAEVAVRGSMEVGARGTVRPVSGPRTRFTFTEVTPGTGFTTVTRLPLAHVTFTHHIEPTPSGSRFTHGVTINGPLSWLFGRLVGQTIAADLSPAMRKLAAMADASAQ